MVKKIVFPLLIIMLLFSLVACNGDDPSATVSEPDRSDTGSPVCKHQWNEASCSTPKTCQLCKETEGEALGHTPAEDDGDCTTPIRCVNCEQNAKAGATGHHDADHDYTCDNAGCQVTVGNPPKDESDGIDLPIDRN